MSDLFDFSDRPLLAGPASSPNDPSSSAEAAAAHDRSGASRRNAEVVLDLVRRHPGATSVELHRAQTTSSLSREEVSRRLADLMRAGRVRQGEQRRCRVKGSRMVSWWEVAL